ncbi:hypothetical protein SH203_00502 [Brevundimonas sp. SH203]|uniref:DUF262 domain-containing protein n=1 Tax=Brevundimonas sp. SH203 TaxID=345167 RepID=UPI0009D425D5|nr:DUF262 domain-containing protein [Brevundimonas sp. SH203]GAW40108.1 hypothetical protein SH203_00502 [Brevundimonas sp. SH203]
MLEKEITAAQRLVRTDAYQMSIGELVNMYTGDEIIIDPEFQRLFRWEIGQKSKLIESLLLGIPLPSIFVFERQNGQWELIDGLQRLSTILEFMGLLKGPDKNLLPPSVLEATKYLPSLSNAVWELTDDVPDAPKSAQSPLDKSLQLAIRRGRIGVEILKRPSDEETKFDLFQRLNAGGTTANAQELRNCIMLMVNPEYFRFIKESANLPTFRSIVSLSDEQIEKQRHMELAVRFIVHANINYDGKLDVEEYIDEGIVTLAKEGKGQAAYDLIRRVFDLLNRAVGHDALRKHDGNRHTGRVGLVALEAIAVGVAKNLDAIERTQNPASFVASKIMQFWQQPEAATLMSPGLRGTSRIQKTIPLGEGWFKP